MSHLPITIIAYLLNGISVTIDKFLLTKHSPNPLIYVFYFSLVSLLAIFFLPFVAMPTVPAIILASVSTVLWTTGAYFLFKALMVGQVSRVIPIVGTLNPIILFLVAAFTGNINNIQSLSIVILILGIIFLTSADWKGKITKNEIIFEVASAFLFAVSYLILREAYLQGQFLSVFIWSRPILIPLAIILVLIPATRKIVLNQSGPKINFLSKTGLLFALGQFCGGISELLLIFAVSLANPAIVNSLQGIQYAFLFIISLILAKRIPQVFNERYTTITLLSKILGIALIISGLFLLTNSEIHK